MIRKVRRQIRETVAAFAAVSHAAAQMGLTLGDFAELVRRTFAALGSISGRNAIGLGLQQGQLTMLDPGAGHPSQTGVEDARGVLQGPSADLAYIDEIRDL